MNVRRQQMGVPQQQQQQQKEQKRANEISIKLDGKLCMSKRCFAYEIDEIRLYIQCAHVVYVYVCVLVYTIVSVVAVCLQILANLTRPTSVLSPSLCPIVDGLGICIFAYILVVHSTNNDTM